MSKKSKLFLERECKVKEQCYLIDLYRIVENLKGTISHHDDYGIWFQGKSYSYNQFRQDGVHMWNDPTSTKEILFGPDKNYVPDGMSYLMYQIQQKLSWGLPNCNQ